MARILIVDDRPDDRALLRLIVQGGGHQVVPAAGGAEALDLARADPPDLVVSDILMPGMDGFTFCRAWRHDAGLGTIPFVFYTASYTGPEDEGFALSIGADRFLLKPMEPATLLAEIERVLTRQRTGQLAGQRALGLGDGDFRADYTVTLARKLEDKVAELETANRRLAEANVELERFAYIASHDLQEPLRTVASFTQLLKKRHGGKFDAEADEFLVLVADAAVRMFDLVNDLLAYSKLLGRGHAAGPVDTGEVCARAVQALSATIAECGAKVTIGPLPVINGIEEQISQLFYHLLANALKFRRQNVPPMISVTAERTGSAWRFAVTDNGIGVEVCDQDVFEVFRKLHRPCDYSGTGIGLAICKRVVQRHGGAIWFDPNPDGGTIFRFTLA